MTPPRGNDPVIAGLRAGQVTTAAVGDILDQLGHRHQFLPAAIRPLQAGMMICGRAMPVQLVDYDGEDPNRYGRLTEALDQLEPGEVYVGAGLTAACASWGELMTAVARRRGAVGAVVDSFHRDTEQILQQGWPVFSHGSYGQDAGYRSTVADYRCEIRIGEVVVSPGCLLIADRDGVAIVPQEIEEEVMHRAHAKVQIENQVREALDAGMSISEAFEKYGVL
jgi:4-hydroxy-4-methyl-2-oxoglutarate aldolase